MPVAAIRYDCVMRFTDRVRQAFSFLESAGFRLEQCERGDEFAIGRPERSSMWNG